MMLSTHQSTPPRNILLCINHVKQDEQAGVDGDGPVECEGRAQGGEAVELLGRRTSCSGFGELVNTFFELRSNDVKNDLVGLANVSHVGIFIFQDNYFRFSSFHTQRAVSTFDEWVYSKDLVGEMAHT